jgi:hypothetical protein
MAALEPIGSMVLLYMVTYGNIYHQYIPNVSIYTIHGSYGELEKIIDEGFVFSSQPWLRTPEGNSMKIAIDIL